MWGTWTVPANSIACQKTPTQSTGLCRVSYARRGVKGGREGGGTGSRGGVRAMSHASQTPARCSLKESGT